MSVRTATTRELALVALGVGIVQALSLGAALFTPGVALVGQGDGEFAHAAARFVARSWLAGDPPWWNPHVGAGAPGLGNPLLGVLDPQSLAPIVAQHLGGVAAASLTLSWLAWLRIVAAAVGAFALARRVGLAASGSWIAALSFSGAGFLAVHAVEASGRVAWLAPWILLAIERLRATDGRRGRVALALTLALAISAGHLETAFFIGLVALAWSLAVLRENPAAGRSALAALACGLGLSAPVLAPAIHYVLRSSLAVARAAGAPSLDLLDVGLLAFVVGVVWRARELGERLGDSPSGPGSSDPRDAERRQQRFAVGGAVALALLALLVAHFAPWPDALPRAWLPDLFGRPDGAQQRYWGAGRYVDSAAAWSAPFALVLVLAGWLSPQLGPLRCSRVIRFGAALALALVWGAPGAVQLAHLIPFTELCDPVHAGGAAALLVALLAGAAFEHASGWSRWTAAAAVALGVGALAFVASDDAPSRPVEVRLDAPDGLVELTRSPSELLAFGEVAFEGWIHPQLPLESAALRVEARDARQSDHALPLPLELSRAPWNEADAARAPEGAVWFRAPHLRVSDLSEGTSSFALVLRGERGRVLGERVLASTVTHRPRRTSLPSLLIVFLSAFAALWLRPNTTMLAALGGPLLVIAATLWFQSGLHATRALEALFGSPERCAAIAAAAGDGRSLSDADLVSPHAALALGWRAADARDGLGVAAFDAARPSALFEGVHPALGWAASGVDSRSPFLRLLDVRALAQRGVRVQPFASATQEHGVHLHRDAPLGVASIASQVLPAEVLQHDVRAFDPAHEAFISGDIAWGPRTPCRIASVEVEERRAQRIRLRAELDGDGLLVLSEQRLQGWGATVDGQPAVLLGADGIFCGVGLSRGTHVVEFRYRPPLLRVGVFLALLSVAGLALLARRKPPAT